jgi:hypothetical protein
MMTHLLSILCGTLMLMITTAALYGAFLTVCDRQREWEERRKDHKEQ